MAANKHHHGEAFRHSTRSELRCATIGAEQRTNDVLSVQAWFMCDVLAFA
jgi:hypothetical protein